MLGIIFLIIANFVLAGLLVYDATVKAQEQTRISIGANINYQLAIEGLLEDNQKRCVEQRGIQWLKSRFYWGHNYIRETNRKKVHPPIVTL